MLAKIWGVDEKYLFDEMKWKVEKMKTETGEKQLGRSKSRIATIGFNSSHKNG